MFPFLVTLIEYLYHLFGFIFNYRLVISLRKILLFLFFIAKCALLECFKYLRLRLVIISIAIHLNYKFNFSIQFSNYYFVDLTKAEYPIHSMAENTFYSKIIYFQNFIIRLDFMFLLLL